MIQIALEVELVAENDANQSCAISVNECEEVNENEEIWAAGGWWGLMSQHPLVTDEVFFSVCIQADDLDELERRRKYREQINQMWSHPETP